MQPTDPKYLSQIEAQVTRCELVLIAIEEHPTITANDLIELITIGHDQMQQHSDLVWFFTYVVDRDAKLNGEYYAWVIAQQAEYLALARDVRARGVKPSHLTILGNLQARSVRRSTDGYIAAMNYAGLMATENVYADEKIEQLKSISDGRDLGDTMRQLTKLFLKLAWKGHEVYSDICIQAEAQKRMSTSVPSRA